MKMKMSKFILLKFVPYLMMMFMMMMMELRAVPVFHTINQFDLSGHVCPLPTVHGLTCPTLCTRDLSLCPTEPDPCPIGQSYCGDGSCHSDCESRPNICACGSAADNDDFVPCPVSLQVSVDEFNATTKEQVSEKCSLVLGMGLGIPLQPETGVNEEVIYWGDCPPAIPRDFSFREPMWISVFGILGFELTLFFIWGCYKRIRERGVERVTARETHQGSHPEKNAGFWSDEEDTLFIKGFRSDPLGDFAKFNVGLVSFGLAAFLGIITADYYGAVTGKPFGIAYENFDASAKMFIGVWVTSVVWFVSLVLVKPRLSNWFRLERTPPAADFIQIEQARAPVVLLDAEDSRLLRTIRMCEARLRKFVGWDRDITSTRLLRTSGGRSYFNYRCVRYVQEEDRFQPFPFPLATTCRQFRKLSLGLTSKEAADRLELKGPNFIPVQVPNFITALLLEFTGFFYLYQLLILWLFYYFAYYQIGLVDTALVFISALIRVVTRLRAQRRLKQMAEHRSQVCTLRDGTWLAVSTEDLVPGDIFELVRGMSIPCDAILIEGNTVIDESSLTGEPLPLRKTSIQDVSESYDRMGAHKASTLFQGTLVAAESGGIALAHRTASDTDRGELMRRMLYPNPVSFIFDVQLKAVVVMLGIWGVVIFILAIWLMRKGGISAWFLAMFGFAQVLSPLLPAALVVGQSVSAAELRKKGIFCVDFSRIVMAGKVRIFCFDKTGTLTKEGLDFLGLCPAPLEGLLPLMPPREVDATFGLGIAACHGVSQLDGSLIGNPVDLEMFGASGWRLAAPTREGSVDRLESLDGRVAHILRRFDFVHARASMSVVVQDEITGHVHMFLKGSFERVAMLAPCTADVPGKVEDLSREGCYVLAMAHKNLGNLYPQQVQAMTQDELEQGLEFLGLVVFKNQLKPTTAQAIQELKSGDTRNVIITGDNAFTAIYIARACGMATKSCFLIATLDNGRVIWRDADDRRNEPIPHLRVLELVEGSRVELGMSGDAFNHFFVRDQLAQLLLHTRVFARMTPRDKVLCVKLHMSRGITAMCGDGGNDCGALRAAHVGLALSEAEASIVSPFSTNRRTVESCVELIRQGRAALASSFASYKFLIMYGQTMAWLKLPSFYFNISLSQNLWILVDAFVTVGLSYAVTQSRATKVLAPSRPTARLLGPQTLASTLGLLLIHYIYGFGAFGLLFQQSFFRCHEFDGTSADMSKWWLLGDSYEGEIMGIITLFQFVNSAAVFNFGDRYRQAWYRNRLLVIIWSLFITLCFYVVLANPNAMGCLLRFNCGDKEALIGLGYRPPSISIPTYNLPQGHNVLPIPFRIKLAIYCTAMMGTGILWEYLVVLGPIRRFLQSKYPLDRPHINL